MKNKQYFKLSILFLVIAIGLVMGGIKIINHDADAQTLGGGTAANTAPTFVVASSSTFTLTTTSQRLLATSTPTRRIGAIIQPINCSSGQPVFMSANRDAAAVAGTGIAAYATSTFAFEDYPGIPVIQGSVQGITSAGTCTVLVTEWRSQY